MKKILFIICLLFFSTSYGLCEEERQFVYPSFLIDYPLDWEVKEISGAVVFMSPLENKGDDFRENVVVLVEDERNYYTSLNNSNKDWFRDLPAGRKDFRMLDIENTVLNNKDAFHQICASEDDSIGNIKYKKYLFKTSSKVCQFVYVAKEKGFDKYLPQAEKMIKSIKIIK